MGVIAQGFGDVRTNMPWWLLGALTERSSNDEIRTALSRYPQTAQVGTILVGGATNAKVYTVTINGVNVSYTADGSATVAEIADGLAVAINAESLVRGQVSAVSNGVDTVTLTSTTPGLAFTASDADAQLTTTQATTASDAADPIPFGRAVIRTGFQVTDELVQLPATTAFTAQVLTLTPTFVAAAVILVKAYEIRGSERILSHSAFFASATDLDTTIDGLVAALNTAAPAATLLWAANLATATALTATAEVPGTEWEIEVTHESGGASVPALVVTNTTGPSEATSLNRAFRGVALRDQGVGASTIGGSEQEYPGNSALAYVRRGTVAVESSQTIASGSVVFVETAAGADTGKFFNTSSATRVALSRARAAWEQDADTNTGSLAALRLN